MSVDASLRGSTGEPDGVSRGIFIVVSCIYLAALSYIANRYALPFISFFLAPLPLLAFRLDTFRFLIFYSAVNLFFFETFSIGSNFYFFQTGDACLLFFLVVYFIKRHNTFSFRLPVDSVLVFLYIFIAYVLIMAIGPLLSKGGDHWLLYDLKKYLVLATAVFFCSQPIFGPKKLVFIFLAFIFFSSMYGLGKVGAFLFSNTRQITWNEIYFSNMFIVGIVLITILRHQAVRVLLGIAVFISGCGMLATQTRSIWISTSVCIFFYMAFYFKKIVRAIDAKKAIRVIFLLSMAILLIEIVMKLALNTDVIAFMGRRMAKVENNEFVNPFSSLGYRMYESYAIWLQRTLWGHGTGAYIYLIQTQLAPKFMHWWSIHSEYMEILHKWGFVGLGLYVLFLGVFLLKAFKLFLSKKKFTAALGAVAFLTIANTAVISITSGYMMRVNMLMWDILMIGVVVYYGKRARRKNRAASMP